MVFSDSTIKEHIKNNSIGITPYDENRVQPASYDISLSRHFRIFKSPLEVIDPVNLEEGITTKVDIVGDGHFLLNPGDFVLGSTEESFRLGRTVVARVEGKSSLGRLGLLIHSTAGWIDPGFRGHITLELTNNAPMPIILRPGMLIGQIAFMILSKPAVRPYGHETLGSKYQDSVGTVESKYSNEAA